MSYAVEYLRELSTTEQQLVVRGRESACMEEKWTISFEEETGEVVFNRSWTGRTVYRAKLKAVDGRWFLTKVVFENRQGCRPGDERDAQDFALVVEHALLRKPGFSQVDFDLADPEALRLWSILGSDIFAPPALPVSPVP